MAKNNGRSAAPAYFAYEGKVYDASNGFNWRSVRHCFRNKAGKDLTDELKDAPHGPDLLDRFPQVGILE